MKTKIVYVRPGDLVEIRLVDHDDFDTTASGWKAQTYPTKDAFYVNGPHELTAIMPITRVNRGGVPKPSPQPNTVGDLAALAIARNALVNEAYRVGPLTVEEITTVFSRLERTIFAEADALATEGKDNG